MSRKHREAIETAILLILTAVICYLFYAALTGNPIVL